MKSKLITAFSICLLSTLIASGQKIIKGYRTLEVPRNDSSILGRIYNYGAFAGSGIAKENTKKYSSLSELSLNDTASFKATIEGELTKVFSAKLGLTKAKVLNVTLKNIEVWDCINYEKLSFTEGKQSYVISVIYAKDIDISLDKDFDMGIKAELDSALSDKFNVKADFSISRNKASTKLGNDLAVAFKLLNVTKSTGYTIPNISITNNNKVTVNECRSCRDKDFIFQDLAEFRPNDYPILNDTNRLKRYRGCFNIKMIHTGQTENGNPKESVLFFCPQCYEFAGDIKPDCQDYNPNVNLYGNNTRAIMATRLGRNELEVFFISLVNVKATYVAKPGPYQFSNYRIGQVNADIILRKTRLKFNIDN